MSASTVIDWAMQTGLSVSLLLLFVMLIRKPVARHLGAGTAYALWLLPLIRLILPALPVLPAKALSDTTTVPMVTNLNDIVLTPASLPAVAEGSEFNWAVLIMTVWLGGAALWLLWLSVRQARFNSAIRQSTGPVPTETQKLIKSMAQNMGLRQVPMARQAIDGSGPLVAGLSRPVIVLPAGFEMEFTADQRAHAIAHELSHIKQGDLWISAAALVFRAVNWPNPLVHLAASQFRADQEAACDARVIALLGDDRSTKTAYADTLIKAARLSNNPSQMIMVPNMPLGLTISNPLKERLMILKTNPTQNRGLRAALAGTAAMALLVTAPLTNAQTPPNTPNVPAVDEMVEKKVMKWVTNDNGVETMKHVEIITENGVTTAWEIDEIGNRIQVPLETLDMPVDLAGGHDGQMRVMVKKMGDGTHLSEEELEVMIAEAMEGVDIEELAGTAGQRRIIVKRMGADGELLTEDVMGDLDIDVEAFVDENGEQRKVIIMENHSSFDITSDGENSFVFHSGDMMKSKPGIMVDAASSMLENIDTSDMDRDARRKVEKAQKALREAQEALAETE